MCFGKENYKYTIWLERVPSYAEPSRSKPDSATRNQPESAPPGTAGAAY